MWFQKISILPPQKGLEILGTRGVSKSQKFKAMLEAKLEFPEGWGVMGQIPSMEGGENGSFVEPHNARQFTWDNYTFTKLLSSKVQREKDVFLQADSILN